MFYTKEITIVKKDFTKLTIDENGIPRQEYKELSKHKADVQPSTYSRVRREYGDYENFSYEIFLNEVIPGLNPIDHKIQYNGQIYEILSLTIWDDFGYPFTQMLIGLNK